MASRITGETILEHISILDKLYDAVRAVNPTMKTPISFHARGEEQLASSCYDFWRRGEACENCVSMRAYRENETFVKLEYNSERVFFVTAVPVNLHGQRVVVEMLKDVTDSGIIEDLDQRSQQSIHDEIKIKNRLVVTDSLTQLYNRRYMDERLPFDLLEARINEQPLSIVLLDIDEFKQVNDLYGHAAGDSALAAVAELMKSQIRGTGDWIARLGGDEFVICMKNTDQAQAVTAMELVRKKVDGSSIVMEDGRSVPITLSIGVETVYRQDITVDEVLRRADQKLYQAKRNGKNSVV